MTYTFALMLCASVVLLAACTSNDGGGSTDGGIDGEGALIMTQPDGIVEMSLPSGELHRILAPATTSEFFLDVAVSPDGSRIAYVVQPPPTVINGLYDAGSNLWVMNRDGSAPVPLFMHQQANQLVRYPQWLDANTVFAIVQEIDNRSGLTEVDYTVQRFNVLTGDRQLVLDDALVYGLSPDGTEIAFSRLDPLTGESLFVEPTAGGEPHLLLEPSQMLQPFNSPRYSPDGATLAFASAEQPPLPSGAAYPRGLGGGGRMAAPPTDGLPQDVWLIDPAGGEPALLAEIQEDFPSLSWDASGEYLYVLGAYGLYEIDMESGTDTRIGSGSFHGSVAWAPVASP